MSFLVLKRQRKKPNLKPGREKKSQASDQQEKNSFLNK